MQIFFFLPGSRLERIDFLGSIKSNLMNDVQKIKIKFNILPLNVRKLNIHLLEILLEFITVA